MNGVLTADALRRAFDASGKRHLILTGGRKSGKTSLVEELGAMPGMTVWEVPEDEDCRCAFRNLFEKKRVICVLRKQDTPLSRELLGREDVFTVDPDNPFGKTGCVIMASGLGKRFSPDGSRNKLTAEFGSKPLIAWVMDAADGLFSRMTAVTRHESVAKLCEERGIPAVFHSLPYRSDTVRLGLEAVGETEGCLFCQGDQPLVSRETIMAMLLCGANDRDSIWRASWNGAPASPILFPAWAYPELMNLPEGKGGGFLLKRYPDRVKWVNVKSPAELRDVDTPSDLRELECLLGTDENYSGFPHFS